MLLTGGAIAGAMPSNLWSMVQNPSFGPSQAIGGTANGCLAGAAQLPPDGPGYEVIRLSRRRYFGHSDMIDFVDGLGRRAQAAGLPMFYVGDMAQPRGGPLPFGHSSHQTGLDVDIWFTLETVPGLTSSQRETPALPSMISPDATVDPAHFGARQVTLLRLAAADPRVDRIFVNPVLKLAMCRGFGGAADGGTAWLGRLRPWWGHDDHFHVRLRCPDGSAACEAQAPIPEGDGCDAALDDWTHHLTPPKPVGPPAPARQPPVACLALLADNQTTEETAMPSVARYQIHIDLPRARVWDGLRDLSRAPFYVPNLTGVEFTTAQHEGVGTSRRVFQSNGKSLEETVVSWDDGYGFTLRLHDGAKPPAPFKQAWFDYRIADAPDGGTLFTPSLTYEMPLGPVGKLLDWAMVKRFATASTKQVAENFKRYYETGEITNPAYKKP